MSMFTLALAAYLATGDAHWHGLYERYVDEALDKSLLDNCSAPAKFSRQVMCYSLYQANASLEIILSSEADAVRRKKIVSAMRAITLPRVFGCA